jgi:PAS domain S-box-containing protein
LKTSGYKKSEVIGHSVLDFFSDKSQNLLLSSLSRRLQGEIINEDEVGFIQKSGEVLNAIVRTSPIIYENEPATLAVLIDITERKRVEVELNRKEKLLSAIAMSIKEFVDNSDYLEAVKNSFELIGSATQVDRVYLFENTYDEAGNGYTSQKIEWISGTSEPQINNPELRDIPFEEVFSFIEPLINGEAYYGIVKDLKLDRTRELLEAQSILSIAVIPIFIDNIFWGFVGFDDCTFERNWSEAEFSALSSFANSLERAIEKSIINKELEKSKKEADIANVLKSQFLANMSHEIRTPMNGIVGFIDLLMRTDLSGDQGEYLAQIKSASNTLLLLINDILDYSKIEADKLELEYIPFDIHLIIKESIEIFTPKANEKRIRINSLISPDIPKELYGDSGRLKQVLHNLIGNALKFTEKGEVSIKLDLLVDKEDYVKVQFEIKDTGIGITEKVLSKLFTGFNQADPSTTRRFGGTGLGLAISKRIIKLMGGVIRVDSVVGKGSTFYVEIDFEKNKGQGEFNVNNSSMIRKQLLESIYSDTGTESKDLRKYTNEKSEKNTSNRTIDLIENKQLNILLAEDTIANQKLASIILNQLGYNVDIVDNGKQAVMMCNKNKYDIILMDCQMPIIDGYEAASMIKYDNEINMYLSIE